LRGVASVIETAHNDAIEQFRQLEFDHRVEAMQKTSNIRARDFGHRRESASILR
jgi:hypothetical protein